MKTDNHRINWSLVESEVLSRFSTKIRVREWNNELLNSNDQYIKLFTSNLGKSFGIFFEDCFSDTRHLYAMCNEYKIPILKFYPLNGAATEETDSDHERWQHFDSRTQFSKIQKIFSDRYVLWNGNVIEIDNFGKSHGTAKPFPFQCCFVLFEVS